jgi:hypothetical protein
VRSETVTLIQDKTWNTVGHISISNNFMNEIPIAQQLKESVKWSCMKLKTFCTAEESPDEETAYRMGENLCQLYI